MGKNSTFVAAVVLAAGVGIGISQAAVAAGQSNPVDHVSNPTSLDYTDVEIAPRNLDEPFVRDGVGADQQVFSAIAPGLEQAQVETLLGAPIRQSGAEWDYNFKFKMQQSQNYLVCQYKVVFDEQQRVSDTVWRRRQCQQLAAGS